jgi:hypothetical protein
MTETADKQRFHPIGAPRFELGTSSPPDWRANQAAPRPATATRYQLLRAYQFAGAPGTFGGSAVPAG